MKRCFNCMKEYDEQFDICPSCGYTEKKEPAEKHYLKPGTVLNNQYIVGTVIGSGGFGIVYKAWDSHLSRMIAIKEYFPMTYVSRIPGKSEISVFTNRKQVFQKSVRRFLEEAQYLAKFSKHSHIVNVYSFFEENNTAYFVMEYLDGISFGEFIGSQGGRIETESAVSVVIAVLEALKEIHKSGIIHRDVAPDNIFLCFDGKIKLMDLGAARFSKNEKDLDRVLKQGYAPPEQYEEEKQGIYTDVYAVGAVLYRALTGERPIESTNRLKSDDLLEPKDLNPDIPDKLNTIILRAMAILPELRFQTDEELIEVLNENYSKEIRSAKEEIKYRKKKRIISGIFATAAVLIGAIIGFFVYDMKKSETALKATTLKIWLQEDDNNLTEDMDVVICGDNTISRNKHAIITYEPKERKFWVQPGESRELVYLNEEIVLEPRNINNGDTINIGATDLRFVALCGMDFSWN